MGHKGLLPNSGEAWEWKSVRLKGKVRECWCGRPHLNPCASTGMRDVCILNRFRVSPVARLCRDGSSSGIEIINRTFYNLRFRPRPSPSWSGQENAQICSIQLYRAGSGEHPCSVRMGVQVPVNSVTQSLGKFSGRSVNMVTIGRGRVPAREDPGAQ